MNQRPPKHHLTCQHCGVTFSVNNSYLVHKRPKKYCSLECINRKFTLDHTYFTPPLNPDKLITLGQFIACGFVQNDHTIIIRSDQSTIDDIQSKLNTKYPVVKSDNGKLKLKITSTQMVQDLGEFGLVHNPMFQEFIPYDILQGLLKTDCYEMKDGVQMFRTPSSKLSLEVSRLVGGSIISETYKDVYKGVLGCDWVVVW